MRTGAKWQVWNGPAYPGDVGVKIDHTVSEESGAAWSQTQTTMFNEYDLPPVETQARKFLEEQMEKFFFSEEGSEAPKEFVPPSS